MKKLLSMRSLRVVHQGRFDVINLMDEDVPERCWQSVNEGGILISVDSACFDFVEVHAKSELRRDGVEALFFIIEGSGEHLRARRREGSCSHLLLPILAYN